MLISRRFKLQNQLTEVLPKVRHIEDYEIRNKQLVDAQKLWYVSFHQLVTSQTHVQGSGCRPAQEGNGRSRDVEGASLSA